MSPVFIIGPMIRRIRAANEKKNQPLTTEEEAAAEAPGLKIGTGVWKWPPVWPYAEDFFYRPQEEPPNNPAAAALMSGGNGPGGLPDPATLMEDAANRKLDTVEFWSETKKNEVTVMDEEAVTALKNHYSFYLRDGMSVLELGAAENSYLPENLRLSRHVGVGLNQELMDQNKALTEPPVVMDLADVTDDEMGLRNEGRLGDADTYDAILFTNTLEFLTKPREVMKSCWRLLKPGGIVLVAFLDREALKDSFGEAQTKMWRNYNDDQHMWMMGSFFQFSVGNGWAGLKGFDISPESAKKDENAVTSLLNQGQKKPNKIFMVQATKEAVAEVIDDADPEKSFESRLWMTPVLEDRDKMLFTPRIAKVYEHFKDQTEKQKKLEEKLEFLPQIYDNLIRMDQFAFPFDLQARLAADLVTDPDFVANDEQMNALKMGLGLKKPSKDFWAPVGQLTSGMDAEDKVNLLSHIVPRFGSNDPAQEAALETFVSGLTPTIKVVKSITKNAGTGMSDADVQLVASELLACETLRPGRSSRKEFATWVGALTEPELQEYVRKRKSPREESEKALKAFQDAREAAARKEEEDKKKFAEQVEKARTERTMFFNPKTGKMEEIKKSLF